MISISRLLCDSVSFGDQLRYKDTAISLRRPIVIWNVSQRCNLNCIHCYSDSHNRLYSGELSTEEAKGMIRGLAEFNVPVLLFSGGEPLLRKDLFELNRFAKELGLRTVISTNGTLISEVIARQIKEAGFDYVGISLDGIAENNDRFRGKKGAFKQALLGLRNLNALNQKAGLRFTITRHNYSDLPAIFKLVEDENIGRVCFYHLVYAGRGIQMLKDDLTHPEMRECLDLICDWAQSLKKCGINKEVLTVDNHADGPYIYLKLKKKDPQRAKQVLKLLRDNGGNSSGMAIANIDSRGFVHPDQFWQGHSFGNIKERPFGQIWQDTSEQLMRILKNRKPHLRGRCKNCGFLDICNGNFRIRAESVYNDIWQQDPACYLTDEEIK
ncbi:MAG: radical SAM protein [Candidatus Omnitrophota bacterium]